ncbi:MAG TPA: hypothetical protein VNA19_12840 [Pyrinomonadaceae bacterium]|jgi:hypothetical protein|nr:hypothetical protein [Pyrinomonadaceae bacterium]
MKSYRANSFAARAAAQATAALVFLFAAVVSASAQGATPRLSSASATSEARARAVIDRNQRQREWNLRHLGDPVIVSEDDKRLAARQQQLLIQQISKDYRVIQELNNAMHTATTARDDAAFDLKQIARHTGEINRRASRLKKYLALPHLDANGDGGGSYISPAAHETKRWLALLDTRIASFVANPFFKNPNVVDAELSTKASRDLRDIIQLSNSIKKNAERLHKTAP